MPTQELRMPLVERLLEMSSNQNIRVDPGLQDSSGASRHVWERFIWTCHASFFLMLLLAATLALVDSGSWDEQAPLLLGLTGTLAIWFAVGTAIRLFSYPQLPIRLAYFATGWSVLGVLMAIAPVYTIVSCALLWHVMMFVPMTWAIPGFLSLTGSLSWSYSRGPRALEDLSLEFIVPMMGALAVIIFVRAIVNQSQERHRLIGELESSRSELAVSERQAGILQERQRLANDIHDTLAQGFTSIVLQLEAAESALASDPKALHRHLDQARATARESLGEARRFVWALRPPALDGASLPEALSRLASRWSEESGVDARATVTGTAQPLSPDVEVALLRASKEALANVRKHADASEATITLSYMDDLVMLDVHDNGRGFVLANSLGPENGKHGGGFGLAGMRQRVEQLGGTLSIESAPGEGATLVVELPVAET